MPARAFQLKTPIFAALDTAVLADATALAAKLADSTGGLKLGLEFFAANGPKGVKEVSHASGLPVFLDLKFHDIPNTVAGAVRAACQLGVFMMTVHAGGGRAMMAAAKAAGDASSGPRPLIVGVTVLTSFDAADLAEIGVAGGTASPVLDQVRRLAALAQAAGLDGVVCSPLEAAALRKDLGPGFTLITPGVRPAWAEANDQKRVMTPEDALRAGADYLVIGRPITAAPDPAAAAKRIALEIEPAVSVRSR